MRLLNNRQFSAAILSAAVLLLLAITVAGCLLLDQAAVTDFSRQDFRPSLQYPFGTDWMGRDMFVRTLCGLSMSIRIGLLTASVSACIAFALGSMAAVMGKMADVWITWLIDLTMGIPHMLLLILISFAVGRGFWGVVVGVTVTHWMSLARVIRGEILQLKESGYIKVARQLGMGKWKLVRRHMLPHLLPQFTVGLILLFPHAILHEAGVTFLGFGLPPEQPAIGIILSESMRYLSMGSWWLALFPGLLLVAVVGLFNLVGSCLRRLMDPGSIHL